MGFYYLSKEERAKQVTTMNQNIYSDLLKNKVEHITAYFSDEDTYIRKTINAAGEIGMCDFNSVIEFLIQAFSIRIIR